MFEWDEDKNLSNIEKHGVSFEIAKEVFSDPKRLTLLDEDHSQEENRYFCIGRANGEILTVRFVIRSNKIRIIGAGYWRKGRKIYDERN
ncbi:MAG: BrnT family toxin [Defluviitaleaceae bacterium]|nr:BrnT family toxin [Defluviitaleaceae bacterium]